jgi:hypothetical protein
MRNIKITHKDYTKNSGNYQLVIPMNFEILIPKDDSVRLQNMTQYCIRSFRI